MVFINPEILETSGSQIDEEGCLSVPGESCEVERPNYVKVRAFNEKGEQFILEAEGLLEIRPHVGTFISLIDLNMISDILYMREHLELAILKDLCRTYDKSQEFRIRLILRKQKSLIESDMSIIELSRAFILADNEFHYTLFDMAGKKNVSSIFHSISSEYERFRTFINWDGKETLLRLHHDHEEIFRCIVEKDIATLERLVSHHIYDGFISGSEIYYKNPEYFKQEQ